MRGKICIPSKVLKRIFVLTPVWVPGIFALGILPGFLWWLLTGNASTAKTIISVTLPGSIFLLMAAVDILFFLLPFWPCREEGPSVWEQWGYLATGSLFLACYIFLILGVWRSNLLLAARMGTGFFVLSLCTGRIVQKRIVIVESRKGENNF